MSPPAAAHLFSFNPFETVFIGGFHVVSTIVS